MTPNAWKRTYLLLLAVARAAPVIATAIGMTHWLRAIGAL
mgnify:CR=1 FL=1